jgi:hypothetical protein
VGDLQEHRERDSLHGVIAAEASTAVAAPPDLSNVPRRPAGLFLGRDAELREVERTFAGAARGLAIGPALHGLGGVGKTELALQFVDLATGKTTGDLWQTTMWQRTDMGPWSFQSDLVYVYDGENYGSGNTELLLVTPKP